MLCDVAIFGELKLPDLYLDSYLCAEAREAVLPGFPRDHVTVLPRSAEAVLEELKGWPLMPPEWLRLDFEAGRLDVRGLVSRDTFLSIGSSLASLYRTAAPHGGGGTLLMVGLSELVFGYSARCAWGRSVVRTLSAEAVKALRESPAVSTLKEQARSPLEALLGEGAGAPFTGM
ncbi:MAG: hypothetical protein JNK82_37170 [Myxococcaceae bacterium]|nr:hypothetical protein [Myxococcaceae bacterium]